MIRLFKAMCGARTPACRVGTRANACSEVPERSHDCERGTQECVRHNSVIALCLILSAFVLHAEPADTIYTARYVVTMNARHDLIDDGAVAVRGQRIVCLLYTSDAADDLLCVDLGGR